MPRRLDVLRVASEEMISTPAGKSLDSFVALIVVPVEMRVYDVFDGLGSELFDLREILQPSGLSEPSSNNQKLTPKPVKYVVKHAFPLGPLSRQRSLSKLWPAGVEIISLGSHPPKHPAPRHPSGEKRIVAMPQENRQPEKGFGKASTAEQRRRSKKIYVRPKPTSPS